MIWYEILLLVLAGALLVPVFLIYYKHISQIRAINTKDLPEEKQQQIKVIMAEQRIARRLKAGYSLFKKALKPLFSLLKTVISSWQERIKALEERYKIEKLTAGPQFSLIVKVLIVNTPSFIFPSVASTLAEVTFPALL